MIARRSIARRKAGGPQHQGRPSLPLVRYRSLVIWMATIRAQNRCEYCGRLGAIEAHHVSKRSAGGADAETNLIMLCRRHHEQTDQPYAKGRLVVEPVDESGARCLPNRGDGRFRCAILTGPTKHEWTESGVRICGSTERMTC